MSSDPSPTRQVALLDGSWGGVARRAARLQKLQFAMLIAFGVLAVLATIAVTGTLRALSADQRADQEVLSDLVMWRDDVRAIHTDFWRLRAEGGSGLTGVSRGLAMSAPSDLRDIAAHDRVLHPEPRPAREELTSEGDQLGVLLVELESALGTSREAEIIDQLDARIAHLGAAADQWVTIKQDDVAAAAGRAETTGWWWSLSAVVLLLIVGTLAAALWVRIERSRFRLVHELEDAAMRLAGAASTDQLTGLAAHAMFHERLAAAVSDAHRDGTALSLILFDLDHFKQINDTFGHQVGDRVLRAVAETLLRHCRAGELVARVGGEELAWLLPGASAEDAERAAERIRAAVAAARIEGVRLTVSAGVCELTPEMTSPELYRFADGALYWAKAHGRDMSCRYTPEVVEELSAEERAERLERRLAVGTVQALARAVDAKDPTTQRHSERVAALARAIALELGWSPPLAAALHETALVHDVGKIGLPDTILFKPASLTESERRRVEAHSELGAQIVSDILSAEQVAWVRGHHERMDGTGYPDGLLGHDIPEGARILALADAWDAMTNERAYQQSVAPEIAMHRCVASAGSQFWSEAVAALERLWATGRLPRPIVDEQAMPARTGRVGTSA